MVILCYKCGEYGFPGYGAVSSTYYPKQGLDKCASVYAPRPGTKGITYGRYRIRYIRHEYSSEKYYKELKRYKSHEIKSWPNGQIRHYVHANVNFRYDYSARCMLARCNWYPSLKGRRPSSDPLPRIWRPTPKHRLTKPLPPQEPQLPLPVQAEA